jgi:hypothetical protein
MSPYARFWFVAPGAGQAAEACLPAGLGPLERVAPEAAPLGQGAPALESWLAELAALHAGRNVLLVGELELLRACAALVLGAPGRTLAAQALTVDWPVGEGGEGAPHLVGVDLDWLPSLPAQRSRFPGGPGAAGSGRA